MKEEFTNKEIEIKDIADRFSFDIDTDDIWANIEPQLPPVKERKKVAFWWMFGLLFLGVALTAITLYDKSESITNEHNINTVLTPVAKNQDNTPKIIESVNINENQLSNIDNENTNVKTTSQHSQSPQSTYDDKYSHDLMNNSNINSLRNSATDISIVRQPIVSFAATAPNVTTDITANASNIDQKRNLILETVDQSRMPIKAMSTLKSVELSLISNSTKIELVSPIVEPVKTIVWHPYWQINSGINQSLSISNFQNINNENIDQSTYERNLLGLSNSIQYGQENSKGWRWFTGVSHNKLITRYSNFDKSVTTTSELGEASKTIDSQGNEFVTLGDVNVTTIVQNDIVWHRNHDYVNIQLGMGKRMMLTNRLSIIGDAYSSYNIWSQHNGYYFDPSTPTIMKFDSSDVHPYQNQGLGIGGRLSLEYDLGVVSIGLSSRYEGALKNTILTNQYNIKNSHYGVQLGVVYRP